MRWDTAATLALAVLLTGGVAHAKGGDKGDEAKTPPTSANTNANWISAQAQSHVAEVIIGKVVVDNARDTRVKAFGKTLLIDHAQMASRIQDVAVSESIRVQPRLAGAIAVVSTVELFASSFSTVPAKGAEIADRTFEREARARGAQKGFEQYPKTADLDETEGAAVGAMATDSAIRNLKIEDLAARLDAKYRQRVDRVTRLKDDADFDRKFLAITIESHQKSIKGLETWIRATANESLEELAVTTIPVLQKHLAKAEALKRDLDSPPMFERLDSPKDGKSDDWREPPSKVRSDETNEGKNQVE